ncbi:Uncharacterised protein [Staphylococcus aureus]|nr:Uncharacterised protein [Staphylococcus aureus]SCU54328.1 Uncharacterised protein [Staphylococcus aureus]
MTETKVKVAFQTIPVTSKTSEKLTTPVITAIKAPVNAVMPISRPLGCHNTNNKVTRKMSVAKVVIISIHQS